jgi:hypothetical protein
MVAKKEGNAPHEAADDHDDNDDDDGDGAQSTNPSNFRAARLPHF